MRLITQILQAIWLVGGGFACGLFKSLLPLFLAIAVVAILEIVMNMSERDK